MGDAASSFGSQPQDVDIIDSQGMTAAANVESISCTEAPVAKFSWVPERQCEREDSEDEEERRDVALARAALKARQVEQSCRPSEFPPAVAADNNNDWILA